MKLILKTLCFSCVLILLVIIGITLIGLLLIAMFEREIIGFLNYIRNY